MKPKALISWSSGKDSAWTLHVARKRNDLHITGLVTNFNEAADRVSMHAVRRSLVEAQAEAIGLPLWPVFLPWPCSNEIYEEKIRLLIDKAVGEGVSHFVFGDLFLQDIRDYRIKQFAGTGIEPLFPIWCGESGTKELAAAMIESGIKAVLTCVDPKQLDPGFVGREFDKTLLSGLPDNVDPCGERGEFHTFCYDGPMFKEPVAVELGNRVERDGFHFADVLPAGHRPPVA